jgi:multidrug efflux pump subunit AcrB
VRASIPAGDNLNVLIDLTTTIRASVRDVERTLTISIILVIAVVFAFLRSPRGTLIPGVAVTVSLIGTFGVMYLVGYRCEVSEVCEVSPPRPGKTLAVGLPRGLRECHICA